MKLFIHYEEHMDESLHKTSKINLNKKWVAGPCSQVVKLFVTDYNKKFTDNVLDLANVHLTNSSGVALANESIIGDYVADDQGKAEVFIKTGSPPAAGDVKGPKVQKVSAKQSATATAKTGNGAKAAAAAAPVGPKPLTCMRFGCQKKFHAVDNHATACSYHRLPPVFHETVKFWACCPDRKCYDWESFMEVPGCQTADHSTEKPQQGPLGGCDIRAGNDGSAPQKLKSIDQFNEERTHSQSGNAAGLAIANMYQLRQAMDKAGVSGDLFDRAKTALSDRLGHDHEAVATALAKHLSESLIALEQGGSSS